MKDSTLMEVTLVRQSNGLIELFTLVVILMTVRPYLSQMMTEYIYLLYKGQFKK